MAGINKEKLLQGLGAALGIGGDYFSAKGGGGTPYGDQLRKQALLEETEGKDFLQSLALYKAKKDIDAQDPAEQRRQAQQDRLLRTEERQNLDVTGRVFTSREDMSDTGERLGYDFDSALESGYIVPETMGDKTSYRFLSKTERSELIKTGKIADTHISYLDNVLNTRDSFQEIIDEIKESGIDPSTAGNILFQEYGPFSLPAAFNLYGQYARDPKYTALKKKLEIGFQEFRKVVTGAQASARELKMLRPLIASFRDRPEVMMETLIDAVERGDRLFENRVGLLEASGRNVKQLRELYDKHIPNKTVAFSIPGVKNPLDIPQDQVKKFMAAYPNAVEVE